MSDIELPNPFVGLRPYEAEESLLFFGRKKQIAELLSRIKAVRFVAVVGSSGCGKSSLVRAGLIPVLQAGFLVEDRDAWFIGTMKPGDAPLANLAACVDNCISEVPRGLRLGDDGSRVDSLVADFHERGSASILSVLAGPVAQYDANVLLVVDQFEELFRFGSKPVGRQWDEAADFVVILIELAAQRDLPIYVVVTMRSDFIGDCDGFSGLPEMLNQGQYLVPRLTREQRRDAIEGPIRLFRSDIAPRLTDRLLNETFDSRDDLPVLQHALQRAWDFRTSHGGGILDMLHYEQIGTVKQALSLDADAALVGMSERERLLTKRMFQALTTVDDTNRGVRRPAYLSRIAARADAHAEEIWTIVQRFRTGGRSFLFVSTENPAADPVIDLSHESLIRQWDLLVRWVGEETESIKTYLRLAESARLHASGRSGLYRDPDLEVALDWRRQETPNAAWAADFHADFAQAMAFLDESVLERDRWLVEREFQRRWRMLRAGIAMITLFFFVASFGVPHVKHVWDASEAMFVRALERHAPTIQTGKALAERAAPGLAEKAAREASPEDVKNEAMAFGKVLAELFKVVVHGLAFLIVSGLARGVFRYYSFRPLRLAALMADPALHGRRTPMRQIMRNVRRGLLRAVETISKWASVLVGVTLLATCSTMALPVKSASSIAYLPLACIVPLALVGWVFAVARLNDEVRSLRDRLPPAGGENLADHPKTTSDRKRIQEEE